MAPAATWYGSAQTRRIPRRTVLADGKLEYRMYIGGGILGTVLLVVLIIYFARRA